MSDLHIYWIHGKDSAPWGFKSAALRDIAAECGVALQAPDFQGITDPDARVEKLVGELRNVRGRIALAGSSMGGYVSTAATKEVKAVGLFLMAPAYYLPGYYWQDFPWLAASSAPIEIIAGWRDEIVPVENIFRFARIHRARLHVCDAEHRLSDAMDLILQRFRSFVESLQTGGAG